MITLLATVTIVFWLDLKNSLPRRRSRAHLEKIWNAAKDSGTLGITRLRLSKEMSSLVPSLLDVTALKPVPSVIITGLDPNSDSVVITGLVNDYQSVIGEVQMEAAARRIIGLQISDLRKSCRSIQCDIDVVAKATESRKSDDKTLRENTEMFQMQRQEIACLNEENTRLKKTDDMLQEEIQCLMEQERQLQQGQTPYNQEIKQQLELQDQHRVANTKLEKEVLQSERSLVYDEHRLQRTKSNLRQLMKEREDLVVSTFTHGDIDALTAQQEFYWCLVKFLSLVALLVMAMFIYVFVTRIAAVMTAFHY